MIRDKKFSIALLIGVAFLMAACSGAKGTTSGGGGGGGTTAYTIGGSVTGLVGSGLVLADNSTDTLAITGTGTVMFTFKTAVSGAYAVTVNTQPTNPAQTCTVTGGTGTATATVTTVSVVCTTNPVTATIGGTVSGVSGTGLVLQNNGGDSLTIIGNGTFTFKTPVTGPTDAYAVTVLTQPTNPMQICTVTNGSGTATADVTNVAVNCVLAYTIGGNVNGVVGTGLILLDTGAEQLMITANGAFTFKNPVPTGFAYTISILQQPSNPAQNCAIVPGTESGTAIANVTNVVVNCQAVTYSVGGNVVGLQGITPNNGPLTDSSFSLQNNLGDTTVIPRNGPFKFATTEALNGQYNISVFTNPSTQQTQGCTTWNYKGVVTGNVTSVVVDCAHNDWTWIDGTKTSGSITKPQYGSFPTSAPSTIPNPYTNTPGARYSAAGWTDAFGNLFLFGGEGWELSGKTQPDTLDAPMNDLWVCVMTGDYCQWQLVGGYGPSGAGIYANAQNEGQLGVYSNVGNALPFPTPVPGGRWGAATWTDNAGNLWLFGGNGNSASANGLLNDLWELNTSGFNGSNYTTATGQWTWVGGSNQVNQPGVYTGTMSPGARVGAVTWKDVAGNFWLFGGYGYDGSSNVGFLNDLWKYTGGTWVYVTGSKTANQVGNYGTQGTASSTNLPGGRQEAVGWADDATGNLWLFGGEGYDSVGTATGILNDLWMYNIASNQWTYVTGSSTANQTGTYELQPSIGPVSTTGAAGTCGLVVGYLDPNPPPQYLCSPVDTTGAVPGSRWGASAWTDAGGNFWLFGGWGLDSTGTNGNGALNDLWVYTPATTAGQPGTWVWVTGSVTGNANGVYGDEIRPYKTYYIWTPGGRSNATRWVDGNGQLWLFGGEGYDATSTTGNGYLNDMWRYLPYPN